jgi:hypothetical protein
VEVELVGDCCNHDKTCKEKWHRYPSS